MTEHRKFKQVRARTRRTGERYAAARGSLLGDATQATHKKLPDAEAAEQAESHWTGRLSRPAEVL